MCHIGDLVSSEVMVADKEINGGFFACYLLRKVLQAQASIQTESEFSFNETHYLCFCSTPCSLLLLVFMLEAERSSNR